jgi:Fe-S-cluster containining protein
MGKTNTDDQPRAQYDCTKCPAYCCAIYDRVQVKKRDINRLARHFGVSYEVAERRYTTMWQNERVLRRTRDPIFGKSCKFLDPQTRGCTIYHVRPNVCREYPARARCAYYDLIQFERRQQADETVVPLVQITFIKGMKKRLERKEHENVWEWTPEKQ